MGSAVIARRPNRAAKETYDLIVVGGGVYGIALLLEAARRGMKPLLLEQSDFGSETSWNSLRIVHGGLRYLQSLDLPRFFESVGERRWFLRQPPTDPVPDPERLSSEAESQDRLRHLLSRLSPRQRDLLHLVFYQELTIEEAAGVLHISIGSARTHYTRGKSRLRELLSWAGEGR